MGTSTKFTAEEVSGWIVIGLTLLVASRISLPAKLQNQPSNNLSQTEAPVMSVVEGHKLYTETAAQVLPPAGFPTKLVVGDMIPRLVAAGVIDQNKFKELYSQQRNISETEISRLLTQPMREPLIITKTNASVWLNIFWAVGLTNKTDFNTTSPINGTDLYNFASTGGWTLGQADSGGGYFNQFEIIKLTPEQERIVLDIAQNTYRPCCNNSTFFQDCNHGSALLGALELGAAEGLTLADLYNLALGLNSFWFPDQYIQMALHFKIYQHLDWREVDPKLALSQDYASASGWSKNIAPITKIPNLLPPKQSNQSCGV